MNNQIKHKIFYYDNLNDNKKYECFILKNNYLYHNPNGAAKIFYYENGYVDCKEYWLNGIHLFDITSDEELKRYIKLQNIG